MCKIQIGQKLITSPDDIFYIIVELFSIMMIIGHYNASVSVCRVSALIKLFIKPFGYFIMINFDKIYPL